MLHFKINAFSYDLLYIISMPNPFASLSYHQGHVQTNYIQLLIRLIYHKLHYNLIKFGLKLAYTRIKNSDL